MKVILTVFLLNIIFNVSCNRNPEQMGEFAPKDAYLPGAKHPYYGSENAWNQRFFSESTAKRFYKRRGQRAMLFIVEGKPQKAVKYCRKLLAEDPNDLESLFNLVVAKCQMKDIKGAMETMKRAVNLGLPFSRFLAGPRDLLKPLTSTEDFKQYRAYSWATAWLCD